ncbi:MAG: N-6 DNA methylase [Verrucomicrobia bacterium]|nr:N-6 DNA methylase [Verrucomicrobiota bacterium]
MSAFADYIREIRKNLDKGDSTEHTHRPALETLLEACGKDIDVTNEPRRIACGAPDFNISRKGVPLGHVETKDVGINLDEMERGKGPNGDQFKRYSTLPNWILTDYLEFHWYAAGEKRLTVRVADLDGKGKLKPAADGEERLTALLTAFYAQPALTVGTAKELANRMAGMTRMIRDLILAALQQEEEKAEQGKSGVVRETMPGYGSQTNWLHEWLHAFRDTLIPDLNEHQFADMFAQTLAYGLFAARVHEPNKPFSRESAAVNLPRTNPFLRELFEQIAGVKMPDTIAWAVDDMVELLKHADMLEILRDFGKCKGREDPVVHFYETFLAAYDPAMREVRGVFYTPEPVVSYIVNSLDWLLKTRLGRPKGLADEDTLILDAATGTATFLYFVIEHIHQGFRKQLGAWDGYVARHLLPRIFGFELLMAPYAVAHLKISMLLEQSGYTFGTDQRLGIYLTNTLEEAAKKSEMLLGQFVSREANAAAEIKRDRPIMVVLGNPPYSGISANRGLWITNLIADYRFVDGKPLGEKKVWLADDYVKFIRFAEWRIDKTGEGVLGYITNHGYLDNPTFRGMRQHLMQTFDEIYVLNLHGNTKKKEKAPDGGKDENVFDIQQGVAILLAVKVKSGTDEAKKAPARVFHADLWGRREIYDSAQLTGGKYEWLWQNSAETTAWKEVIPNTPFYFFSPRDEHNRTEYEKGWVISEVMPLNVSGVVTARDAFALDFDKEALRVRIQAFRNQETDDATIKQQYQLSENYAWRVAQARKELMAVKDWESHFTQLLYRPFNSRYIYFHQSVVWRPRFDVMRQILRGNLALITTRQTRDSFGALVANMVVGHKSVAAYDINSVFPLYLYPSAGELDASAGRRPNISPAFLNALAAKLKAPQAGPHGLPKGVTPEDIFHYAYAVFHSPTYRTRYAEFLKSDFPRLPLTGNRDLFFSLAALGGELVGLHLMESPKLNDLITEFSEKGTDVVEKVSFTPEGRALSPKAPQKDGGLGQAALPCGRVWINPTQYFGGVPAAVWNFHIGGYQVCEKWLKDRKGRTLTYEDIQHYQEIVVALHETIRLMAEIDKVIEAEGGWPIQ